MNVSRREFLAAAPAVFLAPKLISANHEVVRLAMIYSPEYTNAVRAAEMSAAEVKRAASLLKREFHFAALPLTAIPAQPGEWTGIIIAAPGVATLVSNVVDITGTRCGGGVLTLRLPVDKCGKHGCALWHPSLERFGAAQLNDRFRAANINIDDQAWLGWFAVKLLWEAGARGTNPTELKYDGHKGAALHFNRAGILVQPYYLLDDKGGILEEVRSTDAIEVATCDT